MLKNLNYSNKHFIRKSTYKYKNCKTFIKINMKPSSLRGQWNL